jgi:uncharacterized protein
MTSFDLRQVKLRPGESYRDEVEVELPVLEFGGQSYAPTPRKVPADLRIDRALTGTVFALAFEARLHGPCHRCLADAVLDIPIDVREYQAEAPDDDELTTPYLVDGTLQLSDWARDAVALALPEQILCRPDCAGLCAVCGKDLNVEPHEHDDEVPDARWAALEQLRERG